VIKGNGLSNGKAIRAAQMGGCNQNNAEHGDVNTPRMVLFQRGRCIALFGSASMFIDQSSAERHQPWRCGGSSRRWRVVPTRMP
jgi:hypothetical protein